MRTIILLFTISVLFMYGQETPEIQKRYTITDAFLSAGLNMQSQQNGTLADFRALAPQSVFLQKDLSAYHLRPFLASIESKPQYSALLGIRMRNKKNTLLRIGLSFASNTGMLGTLTNTKSTAGDTLISTQTGQKYPTSKQTRDSYSMSYNYDQVMLDLSIISRTEPKARWSFFYGVGFNAGISTSAQTVITHWESNTIEVDHLGTIENHSHKYDMELINNKNNMSGSVYIPLGANLRLGKNNEFWKHLHLFYELRGSLNINHIPELKATKHFALLNAVGLRLNLH